MRKYCSALRQKHLFVFKTIENKKRSSFECTLLLNLKSQNIETNIFEFLSKRQTRILEMMLVYLICNFLLIKKSYSVYRETKQFLIQS